jgi:hypothetical protein
MKISRPGFYAICILVVAGLVALLLPAFFAALESHGNSPCPFYLSQLYKGLHVYVARFGNNHLYPPHRGEMVWLCLIGQCGDTQQHPPEYFKNAPLHGMNELLVCPDSKNHFRPTDYRGPSQILSDDRPDRDPIGADKPGNHRGAGGNVLRFDGSVGFRVEEEYEAALKQLE